ncbi:MAG: hypothetical protein R3293_04820 [Candidatus Promineifilaceae bacterium]|nr:hypothetical protein [Candidatus Promineifilaceae bacterium]
MDRLVVFLVRNDVWIYIISVLGLFWYLTELWRANRLLRQAVFGLERERGERMRNSAIAFIALFFGLIIVVYYVNQRIAPNLPQELFSPPTPTPDILSTPLVAPSPLPTSTEPINVTPDLAPTVTLAGGDVGDEGGEGELSATSTPTAFVPPTPFIDCTADLNISEPRNGAAVTGDLSLFGTADTANFQYYLLETNGPQTNGQWASLLGRNIDQPVREGFLGNSNLSMWQSGPYLIRLTTVDIGNNITGQCVIQVTLSNNS